MCKINVAILFGGISEEYPISLKSAYRLICAIARDTYDLTLIGITRDGRWLQYRGAAERIRDDTWYQNSAYCRQVLLSPNRALGGFAVLNEGQIAEVLPVDVVFPMLHGKGGEDGSLQGLLSLAGIPFVGCHLCASAFCMDKNIAHCMASRAGIAVTPSVVLYRYETLAEKKQELSRLAYPLFVKPAASGSSFGVTKVETPADLETAAEEAFRFGDKILIEQGVEGCEVGCAVMGTGAELVVGEVDEIALSEGFFRIHQEAAPEVQSENSSIFVPARLAADIRTKIQETAKQIYRALGCSGLARIDMFYTASGEIYLNEVNTMPGFTSYSRYPRMMEAIGLDVTAIVDYLIAAALEKEVRVACGN